MKRIGGLHVDGWVWANKDGSLAVHQEKPKYKLVRRLDPIPPELQRELKWLRAGWTVNVRPSYGASMILAGRNGQAFLVNLPEDVMRRLRKKPPVI